MDAQIHVSVKGGYGSPVETRSPLLKQKADAQAVLNASVRAQGPINQAVDLHAAQSCTLPDRDVIGLVLAGHKAYFKVLMRRYGQTLFRAVRSYLRGKDDVQDAMQNAWIKAFTNLAQFHGEACFRTWLVRIGINEALQLLRKDQHPSRDVDAGRLDQLPDARQADPEQLSIRKEDGLLLHRAVASLPPVYRTVYDLRVVEGKSVAEVARVLHLSGGNVKVRLHRAKAMLAGALHVGEGHTTLSFPDRAMGGHTRG